MIHPLLNKRSNTFVYFGVWLLPLIIHVLSLSLLLNCSWNAGFLDALLSIPLFSLMGLSLWFLTYGNPIGEKKTFSFIFQHILALSGFLVLWIFPVELLLYQFLKDSNALDFNLLRGFKILEGSFYYVILISVFYLIAFYEDNREKKLNEEKLHRTLREIELKAIKSQINPHFLFNSLNSVSALIYSDVDLARKTIVSLSEYLRYSLKMNPDDLVDLETEIENGKRYLSIEKIRFGKKMLLEFSVDKNCLKCRVPVLILQPLYENAVKHGVYESMHPINIKTIVSRNEQYLQIAICNNFDVDSISRQGEGIGLNNVRSRLSLLYGIQDLLSVNKTNKEFKVVLNIPLHDED